MVCKMCVRWIHLAHIKKCRYVQKYNHSYCLQEKNIDCQLIFNKIRLYMLCTAMQYYRTPLQYHRTPLQYHCTPLQYHCTVVQFHRTAVEYNQYIFLLNEFITVLFLLSRVFKRSPTCVKTKPKQLTSPLFFCIFVNVIQNQ